MLSLLEARMKVNSPNVLGNRMHNVVKRALLALFTFIALAGCALIKPSVEPPTVVLESLRLLPANGLNQRFELGLRVINPNDRPLPINGMSYHVALNGYELINGVSDNIPAIGAFSETSFKLQASTNLFEALRFVNNFLGGQPRGDLNYRLRADISVAGLMRPVSVEETGLVSLFTTDE